MSALQGKQVLVTREKKQAVTFAEKIEQYGGSPLIADVLQITCTGAASVREVFFPAYDWLFFTSANGVDCFFKSLTTLDGLDQVDIAVVGTKTNQALKMYGRTANFIPSTYNAKTMAEEFLKKYDHPGKLLLIRGSKARPELIETFSAAGQFFDVMEVYKTEENEDAEEKIEHIFNQTTPDYITFTSPSAVTAFCELCTTPISQKTAVVCIGTTTALEAKNQGWQSIIVPDTFTIEGMLEVMIRHAQQERWGS